MFSYILKPIKSDNHRGTGVHARTHFELFNPSISLAYALEMYITPWSFPGLEAIKSYSPMGMVTLAYGLQSKGRRKVKSLDSINTGERRNSFSILAGGRNPDLEC